MLIRDNTSNSKTNYIVKKANLPPQVAKIASEIGLEVSMVEKLGNSWQHLCCAWDDAVRALMRSGKPPFFGNSILSFPLLVCMTQWLQQQTQGGNTNQVAMDRSNVGDEFEHFWFGLYRDGELDVDIVVHQPWCNPHRAGLTCLLIGLKWWGEDLCDKGISNEWWLRVVCEVGQFCKEISSTEV